MKIKLLRKTGSKQLTLPLEFTARCEFCGTLQFRQMQSLDGDKKLYKGLKDERIFRGQPGRVERMDKEVTKMASKNT
ncbi:MAG: hypothetical protein IPJ00_13030 [Saprospirales bacterium]|nr:hypothetical protein [Saprospirales bacterium]